MQHPIKSNSFHGRNQKRRANKLANVTEDRESLGGMLSWRKLGWVMSRSNKVYPIIELSHSTLPLVAVGKRDDLKP